MNSGRNPIQPTGAVYAAVPAGSSSRVRPRRPGAPLMHGFRRSPSRAGSSELPAIVAGLAAVVIVGVLVLAVAGWMWWERASQPLPAGAGNTNAPAAIDPSLVRFSLAESWPVPLDEARALAVGPEDEVYVAAPGGVCIIRPDGTRQTTWPLEGDPCCLAVAPGLPAEHPAEVSAAQQPERFSAAEELSPGDSTGGAQPSPRGPTRSTEPPSGEVLLYIGMKDHVEVWSARGRCVAVWDSPGPKARFTSIAVSDDHVFVADAGSRVVWHYDRQGELLGEIGRPDRSRHIPGFLITSFHFDLAVGGDGLLYVVNPRALRLEGYTFEGDLEATWGRGAPTLEGFFGCCNPAHFCVLPDGRFVTVEKGRPHVKVFTAEGRFESLVATAAQVKELPADLAADSRGRVLLLDASRKLLHVFEASCAPPGKAPGNAPRAQSPRAKQVFQQA